MSRPRHPVTFWAMAILSALFSLFGVLVIVAGRDVGGRLSGVRIVLVFGVGGFAYLSGPALARHGPQTVQRDRVETSAGSEPAFVFPSPRAKRRASAIGLCGIAVGIVGMLVLTGGGPFVIGGAVLLCLASVWSLMSLRHPQLLALTPTRVVVVSPPGTVELPWDAGVDAEIYPMPTGQATVDMVGLVTTDPAAATWSRGRTLGLANRRLSSYVVSWAPIRSPAKAKTSSSRFAITPPTPTLVAESAGWRNTAACCGRSERLLRRPKLRVSASDRPDHQGSNTSAALGRVATRLDG